ncbi:MAG: hypothetical protein ACLQF4_00480 [Xanthobacteraceae bacterium]
MLEQLVIMPMMAYEGAELSTWLGSESTLHEIAEPLDRVIALLEHEVNRDAVLVALGASVWLASRRPEVERAWARYQSLLDDLRKIAAAAPPYPAKRREGRPRTAKEFYDLIDRLASCWERATGKPFRQVNRSAQFVTEVVELMDPARSRALPKVMEKIVAERRKIPRN